MASFIAYGMAAFFVFLTLASVHSALTNVAKKTPEQALGSLLMIPVLGITAWGFAYLGSLT